MAKMLMGAFSTPDQADQAIYELEIAGYTPRDMSIISKSDRYESRSKGADVATGAAAGATTGGAIGGLAGLVAGIGLVPALAGLFIGGPIAAILGLTGAAATTVSGAVTGAAAGGLIGALTNLGLSHDTAESYDRIVQEGGVVIGLTHRDDITAEAQSILEHHGATDVSLIEAPTEFQTTTTDYSEQSTTRVTGRPEPAFGEYRSTTEIEDDLK